MIQILLVSLLAITVGAQYYDSCGPKCLTAENLQTYNKLKPDDQTVLNRFAYISVTTTQDEECAGMGSKYPAINPDAMLEMCRNYFEYVVQKQSDKLFRDLLTMSFKY